MELESALRPSPDKQHSKLNILFYSYLIFYLYSVAVYVGAGSRHEDLQTTGTSYLLQQMMARGSNSRSKHDLHEEFGNMGAKYTGHSDREFTGFNLQVHR